MKRVINQAIAKEITIEELERVCGSNLIAAYKSANSENYCVLACLQKPIRENNYVSQFGFVPLNGITEPRYAAYNLIECLKKVSTQRKLYIFDNMKELITAISNSTF